MIRRPLLFVAVAFAAAVFISYYIGTAAAVILTGAMIAWKIMFNEKENEMGTPDRMAKRRKAVYWLVVLSFAAGTMEFAVADNLDDPALELLYAKAQGTEEANNGVIKANATISGKVRDIRIKKNSKGEEYRQLTLEWREDPIHKSRVLVNDYSESDEQLLPGDWVEASGSLQEPAARRNPNCFDYRLYLRSIGIRTTMSAERIVRLTGNKAVVGKEEDRPTIAGRLYLIKTEFSKQLEKSAGPETAALMQAIMFGDKGEVDENVIEDFQKSGTAHVLAVSGLHIGMIYMFLLRIWDLATRAIAGAAGVLLPGMYGRLPPVIYGRKGPSFLIFIGSFFACYMVMASFSPSVVRAVCMVMIHVFAQITGRQYDLNSAAFLVMTGVLMGNPFMLFNTGFQMSFLAVLTMTLVLPYISKVYEGVLLGSLVVQLGLGPFIIYNFNTLSLLAVLVNVPVIFLTGIIVPLGLCDMTAAVGGAGAIGGVLAQALGGFCMMLEKINSLTVVDGLTTFRVASPDIRLIIGYYLALLLLASEEGRLMIMKIGSRQLLRVIAMVLAISLTFGHFMDDGFRGMPITFVDVGQGDCMLIQTDSGLGRNSAWLIDGGGSENYEVGIKTLMPCLLKNGVRRVDGALVSHLHTDHYRSICEIAREGMVKTLYVYEGNKPREPEIIRDTGLSADHIVYLAAGDSLDLGGGASIDALWPERKTTAAYTAMLRDEENENALSLIFRLDYDGVNMLATGDMDEVGESQLIASLSTAGDSGSMKADILKVGHHGSKYSSSEAFLDAVDPQIAVIQVGKNMYGHPTPEVLERLSSRGIRIYRNDLNGAVGIDPRSGRVRCELETRVIPFI